MKTIADLLALKKLSPDKKACALWCKMSTWTPEEGLLLSLDFVPHSFKFKDGEALEWIENQNHGFPKYAPLPQYTEIEEELFQDYKERADLLSRAINANELFEPHKPKDFLEWLDCKDLSYPPELKKIIQKHNNAHKKTKEEKQVKPMQNRERDADLRLIGALASVILERHTKGKGEFQTQAALIDALMDRFQGDGLSKSNIEKKIAAGFKLLEDCKIDKAA